MPGHVGVSQCVCDLARFTTVSTIARVAELLEEDEDWLCEVANEIDQEDGLIWVYGAGDDETMTFTEFGIETLAGIIEIYM